jgi:hypothetical protein
LQFRRPQQQGRVERLQRAVACQGYGTTGLP